MKNNINKFIYSLLAILVLAIFAQLRIELPESVSNIPITGQTFAVVLIAHLLHEKWATVTTALYLILGALGLPVFSKFSSGMDILLGPTGGYLFGFVITALIIGKMASNNKATASSLLKQMILGHVIILICGFLGLLFILDAKTAFLQGVKPFLLGAFIKAILAFVLLWIYYRLRSLMDNNLTK